jgi:hypothetical protein
VGERGLAVARAGSLRYKPAEDDASPGVMLLPDSPVKSRASRDEIRATGERLKSLKQFAGSCATSSRMALSASVGAACLLLAGCMGSPTYGTGTPADKQLLDDVTGMITLTPKETKHIDHKPRPELVRPAKSEVAVLPPPQDDLATSANPQWPESPEARRMRLRAEATANQANPDYDPQVAGPTSSASEPTLVRTRGTGVSLTGGGPDSGINQSAEFKRRMAINKQGSETERRYLSEPPLTYRQPAATAPTGELGEDEWRKEKDRKKAALAGKKTGFQLSDLWPF